jgi:hypothetical protein
MEFLKVTLAEMNAKMDTWKDKQSAGFSVYKNIILVPSTVKAESTTTLTDFHDDPAKKSARTVRACAKQVRCIAAIAAAGRDPVALRTEQLNNPDLGPILQEVETGQRSQWKDIADRSSTYKSYWAL